MLAPFNGVLVKDFVKGVVGWEMFGNHSEEPSTLCLEKRLFSKSILEFYKVPSKPVSLFEHALSA